MKHNKNAGTLLFLLLFTKSLLEQNIKKTFFVSAGAQKRVKAACSGNTSPTFLPNPKYKSPVKCTLT